MSFVILKLCAWNSKQSVRFPLVFRTFTSKLSNTEFIVDLCFGFRKPNSCVGFTGLDLNSFGTTLTHCKSDLTQQFRLLIYLDLDLFGTWNPLWNKKIRFTYGVRVFDLFS